MAPANAKLREAVGRALRGLRLREGLSLDEVDLGSRRAGVRVTRSHLSRVENGQAELSLSRFLALAEVLGTSPEDALRPVCRALLASRDGCPEPPRPEPGLSPHHEVRRWRLLAGVAPGTLTRADRLAWADAETRVGRWDGAARVLLEVLDGAPDDGDLLALLAIARAAAGRGAIARALVAGLPARTAPLVGAVVAVTRGRPVAGILLSTPAADPGGEALRGILLAGHHLGRGRPGAAVRAASAARDAARSTGSPVLRAEADRLLGRARSEAGDGPGAARAFRSAAREARRAAEPGLLLAVHRETALAARRTGDGSAAAAAEASARALVRRQGLPPGPVPPGPLRGAWCWIRGGGPTGPAVSERSPEPAAGAGGGAAG